MTFHDEVRDAVDGALSRLVCTGALADASAPAISDERVRAAAEIVDSTGICERLAEWRREDRARAGLHPGGRPGCVSDRGIVVMLLLLAIEHSPLLVSRMAVMVARRLSDEAKTTLGIRDVPGSEGDGPYDRIWRALHSALDVIDPFPAPRNRLLTKVEWDAIVAARDPEDSIRKQARIDWVANALLEASMKMIPREVRRRWKGNVCIDATPVPAFGKRGTTKKSDWVGIEPDAAWYVREGDHRDPGDDREKSVRKAMWGWETTLSIMATNDPAGTDDLPLLVAAIGFGKPGVGVSSHAVRAFSSIVERGYPAGFAVADRAYFPNSVPSDLQLPLRALGYDLVFDYREDQLGVTEQYGGAIQVEGAWYCPAMPSALVEAAKDYWVHKSLDEATYLARIDQRRAFVLHPKERPDEDGYVPMRCPAAGPSATVLCPLKAPVGRSSGRTRVMITPSHPDRICTNKSSVSFPPTAGAKYAQTLHYGSSEWHAMYSTARNTIEGFNGYVKDPGHEALGDPGRRRVRGYAAQYLFTAILVMAANIRKLRAFLERAARSADRVPTRTRLKRRRDRLSPYLPTSIQPTSGDPPAAA